MSPHLLHHVHEAFDGEIVIVLDGIPRVLDRETNDDKAVGTAEGVQWLTT